MTGATTICEAGHHVGTGRGRPWSSADVEAVKAMHGQGLGPAEIGRRLGIGGTRVRDLIRRLEGRVRHRTRGRRVGSASYTIKGTARIERRCLRCRDDFVADSRFLFMCMPCREYARDAA